MVSTFLLSVYMFFSFFKRKKTLPDKMKYLIVGLGNVGNEYDDTRHNIGFEVVDALAKEKGQSFKLVSQAFKTEVKHKGRTFILIKPTTYMNLSGKAVRYWMQKEKISPENLLVVVDDLNIHFGKVRLKGKGSDGGHNGLKNITELLGNSNYPRLRLGIGDAFSKGKQVNFVLGKWDKAEREQLPEIIQSASQAILSFGTIGLPRTMNEFNKK